MRPGIDVESKAAILAELPDSFFEVLQVFLIPLAVTDVNCLHRRSAVRHARRLYVTIAFSIAFRHSFACCSTTLRHSERFAKIQQYNTHNKDDPPEYFRLPLPVYSASSFREEIIYHGDHTVLNSF